jgi:hypothetical protein
MNNYKNDKPAPFYLRAEYITWLRDEEGYTAGSANSYASYVSAANKSILTHYTNGRFFEAIKDAAGQLNTDVIEEFIDSLTAIVINIAEPAVNAKYKNGLIQYRNFLISHLSNDEIVDDIEPVHAVLEELKKDLIIPTTEAKVIYSSALVYDKDALKKIFFFRMVTQDRCYGQVYFVVSFLKKLFYQDASSRKFFDNYIHNQIDNIQLHTNAGTIKLADIKSLTIGIGEDDELKVSVTNTDDSVNMLHTRVGIGNELAPMSTGALKMMAIDHIFPMKLILEEQAEALPALKRITDAFKAAHNLKPHERIKNGMIKSTGKALLAASVFSPADVSQLKQEMNHIQKFIELQLMDGRENLLKKAKFEQS